LFIEKLGMFSKKSSQQHAVTSTEHPTASADKPVVGRSRPLLASLTVKIPPFESESNKSSLPVNNNLNRAFSFLAKGNNNVYSIKRCDSNTVTPIVEHYGSSSSLGKTPSVSNSSSIQGQSAKTDNVMKSLSFSAFNQTNYHGKIPKRSYSEQSNSDPQHSTQLQHGSSFFKPASKPGSSLIPTMLTDKKQESSESKPTLS